jgi:hypothetical protein
LKPVAWPVSASSVRSSSEVYFASSVSVRVARNCGDQPGGMPGGAAGELPALQQHHVA